MKKLLFLLSLSFFVTAVSFAQKGKKKKEAEAPALDSAQLRILTKLSELKFKTEGTVSVASGKAQLKVPAGFKYLDAEQSHFVLEEFWGNPPQTNDGMLFLADAELLDENNWAFIISYENEGHIDDSDAKDIKYDELLTQMKEDTKEGSKERVKMGYGSIELVAWASPPYYDTEKKTLHWAKELRFDAAEKSTLNYDVRILGRLGLISMNAVGNMSNLEQVKSSIPAILTAVEFTEGNKYWNFDSNVDKVAAVGIGGLVAGKILAKVGFFAIFLKYIKVIGIAVLGGGSWLWSKITGRKQNENKDV